MAENKAEVDNFIKLFLFLGASVVIMFAIVSLKFRDFTGAGLNVGFNSIYNILLNRLVSFIPRLGMM